MTQNGIVNKMNKLDPTSTGRHEFLTALYKGSPSELYLELRCIHPTTGEARSLWGQVGNQREVSAALRQADVLNREGFGVYFAPCLRKAKQGKAETAALVPTLWIDIDCDDDKQKREKALTKLREIELAPSFILDSGGGWHGYWLLDEPFLLQSDADWQKIAGILRGLFATLGGDPEYVKTVAGVMRLPDSINTKPERGGVVVSVVESHPEWRYRLDMFDWFASQPRIEKIGGINVVTSNETMHPILPSRTEQYLASGATNGNRNSELFAAACQIRDAGQSQTEAERILIPRYLADGSGGENLAAREREAHATISSAYSHLARDPIVQLYDKVREQVDTLVNHYHRDQNQQKRPTATQVREVVIACAMLDPLQWAQERKRLKAICGDAFRVEDLNQMHKQARRDLERGQRPTTPGNPHYVEIDGSMIFEKSTERGIIRQTVADWLGHIVEWITQVNDDGQIEHMMRLEVRHSTHATMLDVPSELFGDPNALQRFITQKAGGIYAACAGMNKHLPSAILKLSGDFPTRQTYRFMGWTRIDERWLYVSPELSVCADGVLAEPKEVELENRLRDYRLRMVEWQNSLDAFRATVAMLPKNLAPALLAFTILPVIHRFFPAAAPKPALHLVGTTGSGKSEIAAIMSSFYGQFTRDAPPAQWGDTVNTVEMLGYALADTLYWVDDYKTIYSDERTFTRFLQSYSRGMGRGRLTREAKLRHEHPCRGLLLSTGETTIEGEASVVSRMLVLEIPPWEQHDPAGTALVKLELLREHLTGFTTEFIQWIARQADTGTLTKELTLQFGSNSKDYQDKLLSKLGRQAHTGRMVQNWAVLATAYQILSNFLRERDADALLPLWQDAIFETIKTVQQERAGQSFLNLLGQLVAGGQCVIEGSLRVQGDTVPGATVVGYRDDSFIYLLPDVALREVNKIQPLKFTVYAIGSQLREDGHLIPGKTNLTVQRSVRGSVIRLWRLKSEILGCEECETCENDD